MNETQRLPGGAGASCPHGAGGAGGAVLAEAPSRATPSRARPRSPSSSLFGFYFSPWPFLRSGGCQVEELPAYTQPVRAPPNSGVSTDGKRQRLQLRRGAGDPRCKSPCQRLWGLWPAGDAQSFGKQFLFPLETLRISKPEPLASHRDPHQLPAAAARIPPGLGRCCGAHTIPWGLLAGSSLRWVLLISCPSSHLPGLLLLFRGPYQSSLRLRAWQCRQMQLTGRSVITKSFGLILALLASGWASPCRFWLSLCLGRALLIPIPPRDTA